MKFENWWDKDHYAKLINGIKERNIHVNLY